MRGGRFLLGGAFAAGLVATASLFGLGGAPETRAQQAPASTGLSHVRVVRLSFVEGKAAIRVPGSDEWTEATVNTPIQEGFSVSTDQKSFAEVQFENGSTVRIGAISIVDFPELALTPQGGHINHMELEQGYATFDVSPARHDEYVVGVAGVNVTAEGKSEFRADASDEHMRVEVFSGSVRAADASHSETVGQNHSLVRDDGGPAASFQVSDKVEQDDWDKWVRERGQQSTLAMKDTAITAPSGSMYGWDDLDVYVGAGDPRELCSRS
jgi:ferric-dicitrate binding protein FerR (iron transport regulator)